MPKRTKVPTTELSQPFINEINKMAQRAACKLPRNTPVVKVRSLFGLGIKLLATGLSVVKHSPLLLDTTGELESNWNEGWDKGRYLCTKKQLEYSVIIASAKRGTLLHDFPEWDMHKTTKVLEDILGVDSETADKLYDDIEVSLLDRQRFLSEKDPDALISLAH